MVDTSDLLPKTPRYLKVPLIILNAILWVLGLVLVICGGIALSQLSHLNDILNVSLPAGIIVIGVFFMVLTIVGCVVAYREKLVGLVFYTIFLLVLLVCLIGVGGGAFSYRNNAAEPLGIAWNKSTEDERKFAENYFKCCCWNQDVNSCGPACMSNSTGTNERNATSDYPYCKGVIVDFVMKNMYIAGAAGVTVGVIEFISMLFALFLIVRICRNPRPKSYD
ncbi:hypothetical protein SAMD00019534_079560 [Acytostelium subglobosum LB1]|uniref:hypothetical protein n=1 Tax=Acytostelium subglobosum LB1 TaxID=1410327 RepID=UPI000645224D|nr:hypothetical protein SAMD00019534_079560 [Acytostelium subglobosum LB1]GAM24781.1 hypothetical protein SAMD00019534_079560 [Acytostelium subglobosum LB1]|eukprot:XP_012752450.1 hypothetical protein SAMD00019534_079560 [Acytostelium subglobosum LB1]